MNHLIDNYDEYLRVSKSVISNKILNVLMDSLQSYQGFDCIPQDYS